MFRCIFYRVDPKGRTIGEILQEDISTPLGIDVFIGIRNEHMDRVFDVSIPGMSSIIFQSLLPFGRKTDTSFGKLTGMVKAFRGCKYDNDPKRIPLLKGMKDGDPVSAVAAFNSKEVS